MGGGDFDDGYGEGMGGGNMRGFDDDYGNIGGGYGGGQPQRGGRGGGARGGGMGREQNTINRVQSVSIPLPPSFNLGLLYPNKPS